MKTGKTLMQLAEEIERQLKVKKDFVVPSGQMNYKSDEGLKFSEGRTERSYKLKPLAEEQLASRLQIPKKYFDRMKDKAPVLLEDNVDHWLHKEPVNFLVRTLDEQVRALLSNRYRPLDNYDLCEAALPILASKEIEVKSCEVTDTRLYIKAITPKVSATITKGDVVQAGIVISNSEVGCGAVKVEPMIYRLVCLNGLISADSSMKKYHVGRGNEEDVLREFFRDETKVQDDKAFWMKVKDIVKNSLEHAMFKMMVEKMKAASQDAIVSDPIEVVEVVQKNYGMMDNERTSVLKHLLAGNDLSKWGLVNAVTRTANDLPDYDRATEFERIGGQVLELKGKSWEQISKAAN